MIGLTEKHLGVQQEAIYNSSSQKHNDKKMERRIDLHYVNIPLLLTFRGIYGLADINDSSKTKTTDNYFIIERTNIETYSGCAGLSFML